MPPAISIAISKPPAVAAPGPSAGQMAVRRAISGLRGIHLAGVADIWIRYRRIIRAPAQAFESLRITATPMGVVAIRNHGSRRRSTPATTPAPAKLQQLRQAGSPGLAGQARAIHQFLLRLSGYPGAGYYPGDERSLTGTRGHPAPQIRRHNSPDGTDSQADSAGFDSRHPLGKIPGQLVFLDVQAILAEP